MLPLLYLLPQHLKQENLERLQSKIFYQSLNPTQSEISSYVDKHGPFAGTMMATAKPLSRALRAKLSELLVEQEQLLERIRTQRKNTKELPEMDHIVAVLNKVPEYQKKMQWIKGSMQLMF